MPTSYLNDKADFSAIQRVLVIKLQHLGDVLLASPVFSVLKQRYPHLEIDALIYADTAAMLNGNPHIGEIFTVQRNSAQVSRQSSRYKLMQEYRLLRALHARRYELIIALTDRLRASWLTRLLRPVYSVAQKYPHKRGTFWRNSFTHLYSIPAAQRRPIVEIQLDALRRLGLYPQNAEKRLEYYVNPEVDEKIAELLADQQLQGLDYVVVHPTSRWMFKGWNIDGFAAVLRDLTAHAWPVVLVSGPDQAERDYAAEILQRYGTNVVDLSGRLTLQELASVIKRARCFIGLDSVAMHLAAAVGTPCVALFGPSDERVWGPWMALHRVVASGHSCRPCNLDGCGNGKVSDCLQTIESRTVSGTVLELLASDSA